ncbi:hypothetical protein MES4922_360191 [Mesorhizobium ventifaucium]|uniref:Uncharacterized protein n=1 Tax=Mesorhizobium ventifaucium TaxID=666020 RepID=A0ABM9E623_9HYPH|nr:hypothetical protein MES4922_360191 [Mesorhizobium ventifaucium]
MSLTPNDGAGDSYETRLADLVNSAPTRYHDDDGNRADVRAAAARRSGARRGRPDR